MEESAKASNQSIWQIAKMYTNLFLEDLSRLNITLPSKFVYATHHIEDMIDFIKKIEKDHCYQLESGLYFDTTTIDNHGHLARSLLTNEEGFSRLTENIKGKRNFKDFAVWRTSQTEDKQMLWDSPWGKGVPGWHIECSAMSLKYLGNQFDIHTGGIDHREIHHCNEIAQNQAFTKSNNTGANFWLHNNFLVNKEGKMSKSNSSGIMTLRELMKLGIHPLAYRLFCLSCHYRSELDFSIEQVVASLTRLKRLKRGYDKVFAPLSATHTKLSSKTTRYFSEVLEALRDDLNYPKALVSFEQAIFDVNLDNAEKKFLIEEIGAVFGLKLGEISLKDLRITPFGKDDVMVEHMLETRRKAREAKNYALADEIRKELENYGVELMDGDSLCWDWKII
jgi:cysteinyl-tRNA synthetase